MSNTQVKKYAIIAIAIIIGIVFIVIAALFFTSATLTIQTNNSSNVISLFQNIPTRQTVNISQNDERADVRVRPGTYTAIVKNGDKQTSQVLELKPGSHESINLNLPDTVSTVEPVSSLSVIGISADNDDLKFIDVSGGDKFLYDVNKNNTMSVIDSTNFYQDIKWASPSYGIARVLDKSNKYQIVRVSNNKPTVQTLPFQATSKTTFAVSANNDWYTSDNSNVYRVDENGGFTKIYTSKPGFNVAVQSSSDNAVLLMERRDNIARGTSSLITINKQNEKYQIQGEIYESSWSPDGSKIAVSGDLSAILDSHLTTIKATPASNFNSPTWLDSNTMIYSVSGMIFRYELASGKSSMIGKLTAVEGQVSQIYASNAGDYLYLVIQKGGNRDKTTFGLSRLGLQGQPQINTLSQQLDILVPNTISGCEINYINFVKTSILYKAPSKTTNCEGPIRNYFTTYQVDSAPLNFQYFGSTK